MVLRLPTWKALRAYKLLNAQFGLKQVVRRAIPLGIHALAARTSDYENAIRARWNQAKSDIARRGDVAVTEFIDWLVDLAYRNWEEAGADILGVDELTPDQQRVLDEQLAIHVAFIRDSLRPAIQAAVRREDERPLLERLAALDHRVIAMYAGALWSAGSLLFAMFDGVQARDLASIFMFAGPDDAATCRGPRGCHQYANGFYTLAQILADDIIPGRLACLTNCRHILLPIVRIPPDEDRPDFATEMAAQLRREGF